MPTIAMVMPVSRNVDPPRNDPSSRARPGFTGPSPGLPRRCLECGAALPMPSSSGGRPRRYCGLACLRRADRRREKLRCREGALRLWQQLLRAPRAERLPYSRDFVRLQVRELRAELWVLENQAAAGRRKDDLSSNVEVEPINENKHGSNNG